ncbi:uncharacterized protein BBOV_IV000730 [Babesia bovis T2Bo]|uniref:Uncharacterized protein n=1 Tax=Babesia bovis TaxID=5865 RepID=A7AV45_BABBO|nr:uncharacterized protein BBOV_IV000730 [Babesia bovis T2Bo]EDO05671.1 hypothetical protein BBOV_IV000730 [Babesia bovis T2Bo]|eukprot:XP_001609239.1 hypothetical protein [Babesia bovis T2Bo]
MDSRGDSWGGNNRVYNRKAMPPKMMGKGHTYMMQVLPQQGVYAKSQRPTPMMMPHGMPQMPPSCMGTYPDNRGMMPKMMGMPVPGYMPKGKVGQRPMMPRIKTADPMANRSPIMGYHTGGGSPHVVGKQHMMQHSMVHGAVNMMPGRSTSPRNMGNHISPIGMAPNLVPGHMMANNASPKGMMPMYPHDPMHNSNSMVVTGNRATSSPHINNQMMGPPVGVQMAPMHPGSMGYDPRKANIQSQMLTQGRGPGLSVPQQQPPMVKVPTPMMKHGLQKQNLIPNYNQQPMRRQIDIPQRQVNRRAPEEYMRKPLNVPPLPLEEEQMEPSVADEDTAADDTQTEDAEKDLDSTFMDDMRESVKSLISEQLSKAASIYGTNFTITDEDDTISALIEGFIPIFNQLWIATKSAHKYSMDEVYMELTNPDTSLGQGITARREIEHLESYFRDKSDVEKCLSRYRTPMKPVVRDTIGNALPLFTEVTPAMRAEEYAEISYNQRHMSQKITAVHYRNALEDDVIRAMLPESFRIQQIKMASCLHFDSGTPPQCVSPPAEPAEKDCAASALSKCATTMETSQFSSVASKLLDQAGGSFFDKLGELPMLQLDMRFAKAPQIVPGGDMMMQFAGGKAGFPGLQMPFPKGVNYPLVPIPKMMPLMPPVDTKAPGPVVTQPIPDQSNIHEPKILPDSTLLVKPTGMSNPSQHLMFPGGIPVPKAAKVKAPPPMFGPRFNS